MIDILTNIKITDIPVGDSSGSSYVSTRETTNVLMWRVR